jgi:flagellar protein FliO/FliZ
MGMLSTPEALRYLFGVAVVLASLWGLLWALKRWAPAASGMGRRTRRLSVIESHTLGARQKLVLVRVDGQDMLLGVTPTHIAHLHSVPVAVCATPGESV